VLIDGYTAQTDWGQLGMLLARLALSLYLTASALARFDKSSLPKSEVALRLLIAVLVLWKTPLLMTVGLCGAVALLVWHHGFKKVIGEPVPQ
jgi:nitrate reductase NapE component